jgi:branched-chain amino acid transport system permease protein
MDISLFSQYLFNGLMLGVIYAMVAVGFTLFFGVLDVIKFSHGEVLTVGAFLGYSAFLGLQGIGVESPALLLAGVVLSASIGMALLGGAIAKYLVLPLRSAPTINVLLITLMLGTVLRESIRLYYPNGSNPKPFPRLLPVETLEAGAFSLRLDSVILLLTGIGVIMAAHFLITRTKLGLAIRAVAQDGETARIMGINFEMVVFLTFALGSAMAGLAGVMNGLYYNEINFGMGLLLGIIGFSAAVIGGLGNMYGAILGGFLFSAMQTVGAVVVPALIPSIPSAYKDVFAFVGVILLMAWRPTGLISEKSSERV